MRRKAYGFTLIEMLVSLSIFASLMAVLMLGLSQGLSLWDKGIKHAGFWQAQEFRYGLLSSLFSQAQLADYRKVGGTYVPHFYGRAHSVEFISRSPILDFSGRIQGVRLFLERQESGETVLTYQQAGRSSDSARGIDWAAAEKITLLDGLSAGYFRFEAPVFPLPKELDPHYLDAGDRARYREVAEWVDTFDADVIWRLPRRVAFVFTVDDLAESQWTFSLPSASDAWSLEIYSSD